jgi:hypothetical protein
MAQVSIWQAKRKTDNEKNECKHECKNPYDFPYFSLYAMRWKPFHFITVRRPALAFFVSLSPPFFG